MVPSIEFFERDPNNAGESVRIDLHFAMQDLAGDGERQLDDFAFDAAIVILPFSSELVERAADLPRFLARAASNSARTCCCALWRPCSKACSVLKAALFLGGLAGIGGYPCTPPGTLGFGVGERRGLGDRRCRLGALDDILLLRLGAQDQFALGFEFARHFHDFALGLMHVLGAHRA